MEGEGGIRAGSGGGRESWLLLCGSRVVSDAVGVWTRRVQLKRGKFTSIVFCVVVDHEHHFPLKNVLVVDKAT